MYLAYFTYTPPPPDFRPYLPFLKVQSQTWHQFWILSNSYLGFLIHGSEKHSTPCLSKQGHCPHCGVLPKPRYEYYVAALSYPGRQVGILHITDGARKYCPELDEANGKLRGNLINARRMRPHAKAALQIKLTVPHIDGRLPEGAPDPDLSAALHRHWRIPLTQDASPDFPGECIPCA